MREAYRIRRMDNAGGQWWSRDSFESALRVARQAVRLFRCPVGIYAGAEYQELIRKVEVEV